MASGLQETPLSRVLTPSSQQELPFPLSGRETPWANRHSVPRSGAGPGCGKSERGGRGPEGASELPRGQTPLARGPDSQESVPTPSPTPAPFPGAGPLLEVQAPAEARPRRERKRREGTFCSPCSSLRSFCLAWCSFSRRDSMVAAGWGLGTPGPLRLWKLELVPPLPRGPGHVTAVSREPGTAPFETKGGGHRRSWLGTEVTSRELAASDLCLYWGFPFW